MFASMIESVIMPRLGTGVYDASPLTVPVSPRTSLRLPPPHPPRLARHPLPVVGRGFDA
jgi:hypothetical protein